MEGGPGMMTHSSDAWRNEPKNSAELIAGYGAVDAPPRVRIPLKVFQKLKYFIDLCPWEINGLGRVIQDGNEFCVTDVFLLRQYTSAPELHVETDSQALNECIVALVQSGGDPSELTFQWHSHAHCSAFFSSEDVDTIRKYQSDYMISFVMNKQSEFACRLDIFRPVKLSLSVSVGIEVPPLQEYEKENCLDEIRKNVYVISSEDKEKSSEPKPLELSEESALQYLKSSGVVEPKFFVSSELSEEEE